MRHLETGNVVYRCQSRFAGVESVDVDAGERLETDWTVQANFGRGHYAVMTALLNEEHCWVARSAPVLLTVTERQSEQAVVYLAARCEARSAPVAVAGARDEPDA